MTPKNALRAASVIVALAAALSLGSGCGGGKSEASSGGAASPTTPGLGTPGTPGFPGVPGNPQVPATQPGTTFAFVSTLGGKQVDVFDVATGMPATALRSGFWGPSGAPADAPTDVAVDPAKTQVLVSHFGMDAVVAHDPVTYAPLAAIDLSSVPLSQYPALSFFDLVMRFGYAPMGVVVAPNGKGYVPAMISVSVIENGFATKGIMDLDAPPNPSLFDLMLAKVESLGAFRAAAANGRVFVTNFFSDTVTVIDTFTDSVLATIPVGRGPAGIAVDPRGVAYVCCAFSGEVWTIDTLTLQLGQTIFAGVGPIDVACDAQGNYVYVTNYLSADISKIDALAHVTVATIPASNMTSLLNALGMSPAMMQQLLNQLLAGFGGVGAGAGTTAGGLSSFLSTLLGGMGGGGSGGAIASMLQQVLNSFLAPLGGGAGGLPVAGIWGIGVAPAGDRLVVANAMTGEVSFIDPTTGTLISSQFPGLTSGQFPLPGVSSVEILTR